MSGAITTGWQRQEAGDLTPLNSAQLYEAFEAGRRARRPGTLLAKDDSTKLLLWGVDWQYDFLAPDGTLSVPGGLEALGRFLNHAYDNAEKITMVTASQDDHPHPFMIFFPATWIDADGNYPEPSGGGKLTIITFEDLRSGRWRRNIDNWQIQYVHTLEGHQKQLVIWPLHCLRGTQGAQLAPAWQQFMYYWAGLRNAVFSITPKGSFWGSEMYAPQRALVPHPQDTSAVIVPLYDEMEEADIIIPGGVAENFCVAAWVEANIVEFAQQRNRPEVLKKFRFNREFTAPIEFPGYEDGLRAQYAFYRANGVQFDGPNPYL